MELVQKKINGVVCAIRKDIWEVRYRNLMFIQQKDCVIVRLLDNGCDYQIKDKTVGDLIEMAESDSVELIELLINSGLSYSRIFK